ncbi:MAG TPA: hypothetical protein VK110_11085, partial [Salinisphaeraceae bacterium]|nr:hypothetical protein [Salinisphaeraceae bacterium]
IRQLAGTLAESVIYNLPADYYEEYIDAIQALTLDDLAAAAEQLLQPGAMTWIVVGDLNEIGDAIRSLDWARVQVFDDRPENNAEAGDDTQ